MDEQQHPHPQPGDAGDDEAFARLRAADPAADARLDAGALRAEVARRTAGDGAAPRDGADVPPDGATVTTLAGRRRSRWLQVAAVGVGAALLAGGGGYAIGAAGDGGDDLAGTAGPIVLGQGGATGLSGAADGPETAAGADAMRIAPGSAAGARSSPPRACRTTPAPPTPGPWTRRRCSRPRRSRGSRRRWA